MKNLKIVAGIIVTAALVTFAQSSRADGTNSVSSAKPDLLKNCPVSGEKLGADMGKPYVFVYQGQEVKLCCPDCKEEFDKNPAKFLKKIQDATAASQK
jgi:YHS domain-containing protein